MTLAAEREFQHIGESNGCADHDHESSRRLDSLWRYDQYIANADFRGQLVDFWESITTQEKENIRRLKALIKQEIQNDCF